MKNKFTFFDNFKETADKLPVDLRLKFYDAMTDYVFKGIEPEDVFVSALIMAIKPQLNKTEGRGGLREGAGAPKNNQNARNQSNNTIKNNQKQSNKIKINQNENFDCSDCEQKTKEKIPPHPQENKNKNIYPPVTPNGVYPPLPKKSEDDSGMLDIEELIAVTPKKKRFIPPKIEDINAYIAEKGLIVNGQVFFDYFTTGNWKDSEGKPVKNWKQKLITWNDRDRRKRTIDAACGLLNSGVKSGTYGNEVPL